MQQSTSYTEVLEMSIDDLLEMFGAELLGAIRDTNGFGEGQEGYRIRAKNWLSKHWKDIRQALQENPKVVKLAKQNDEVLLMSEVVLLITNSFVQVPAAVHVAAILVKLGLDKIIKSEVFPDEKAD